jgi:hypothetical protein
MVILLEIVEIYQLQMGIVSREPMMHSGFFRLKNSPTIAEQKKLHMVSYGKHRLKKFPSDHGDMVTRYAGAGHKIYMHGHKI